MKQKAIVLDIDGVIFDSTFLIQEISNKALKGEEMWQYYYANCNSDKVKVKPQIYNILNGFKDYAFFISTSRNERCRKETEAKLNEAGIFPAKIYMRQESDLQESQELKQQSDLQESQELKQQHLQEIMKEYNIKLFIDDEVANCKMASNLGIFTMRVVE